MRSRTHVHEFMTMMMIAFVTFNISLVPLIEGPRISNSWELKFSLYSPTYSSCAFSFTYEPECVHVHLAAQGRVYTHIHLCTYVYYV